jgi:hypothetical protein
MADDWIFFKEIDFADTSIMQYHIDTRDFHVNTMTEKTTKEINIDKLLEYPERFFYTAEEIMALLERYFNDSGGKKDWRFFFLEVAGKHWLKYIRIHRFEQGLIFCDGDHHALNKQTTSSKVGKDD